MCDAVSFNISISTFFFALLCAKVILAHYYYRKLKYWAVSVRINMPSSLSIKLERTVKHLEPNKYFYGAKS